jgi:hypothetical protein
MMVSRVDYAMTGLSQCECCCSECDCGCVEDCPVGLERHARINEALRKRSLREDTTCTTCKGTTDRFDLDPNHTDSVDWIRGGCTTCKGSGVVEPSAQTVDGWVWCEHTSAVTGSIGGPHDPRWCPAYGGEGCPGPHGKIYREVTS